jgi:hypothetical protein
MVILAYFQQPFSTIVNNVEKLKDVEKSPPQPSQSGGTFILKLFNLLLLPFGEEKEGSLISKSPRP